MRPLPRALLVPALVLVAFAAPALDAASPECRPGVVFENGGLRVWFHESKGFVKVFDSGGEDDAGVHWSYKTGEVVERDADGAEVARMGLERAYPKTSGCSVVETEETVDLALTVTDDVKADGRPAGTATVVFAYHFNKTDRGAKFDLHVVGWPWQADGTLAYAFDVEIEGGAAEPAENGVGFRDADGNARGFVTWAPNATARYGDGHEETAVVDAATEADGGRARVTLAFGQAAAGYEALLYDPWVGAGAYAAVGPVLVPVAQAQNLLGRVARLLP
ncbi:MAG TPA: hypothetical protein VHH36_02770 [Candidatus Thermoplasmatota archaeon]|nr:hypothetical protein [Candidatus Thermoplasmatota archaeon]